MNNQKNKKENAFLTNCELREWTFTEQKPERYHNSVALIYSDGKKRLVLILSDNYVISKKKGKYIWLKYLKMYLIIPLNKTNV